MRTTPHSTWKKLSVLSWFELLKLVFVKIFDYYASIMSQCFKFLLCCSSNNIFKSFRRRYNMEQVKSLNRLVQFRQKMHRLALTNRFLGSCIVNKIVPNFMRFRIRKSKVKQSPVMERAFLNDEIGKNQDTIEDVKTRYKCFKRVLGFGAPRPRLFCAWATYCVNGLLSSLFLVSTFPINCLTQFLGFHKCIYQS